MCLCVGWVVCFFVGVGVIGVGVGVGDMLNRFFS